MYNVKNQNLKNFGYFGLGILICLKISQGSAAEKAENNERESHYSSSYHEELKEPNKREKLSVAEYFKKHPELLSKASDALPKKFPLYLWLDTNSQ